MHDSRQQHERTGQTATEPALCPPTNRLNAIPSAASVAEKASECAQDEQRAKQPSARIPSHSAIGGRNMDWRRASGSAVATFGPDIHRSETLGARQAAERCSPKPMPRGATSASSELPYVTRAHDRQPVVVMAAHVWPGGWRARCRPGRWEYGRRQLERFWRKIITRARNYPSRVDVGVADEKRRRPPPPPLHARRLRDNKHGNSLLAGCSAEGWLECGAASMRSNNNNNLLLI